MLKTIPLLMLCLLPCGSAPPEKPGAKVVLIAGKQSHPSGSHEYDSGCYLLAKCLRENGVSAEVATGGWPADDHVFEGASAVVLFMDGGEHHEILKADRLDRIGALMRKGVGLALLHYAVEVPRERTGEPFLNWAGGYYERPYSQNPVNDVDLQQASPHHPVSRGWKSFHAKDEWYFRIRFRPGDKRVTPILTAKLPPGAPAEETVAWTVQRDDGGRGFGFTGLHFHDNWRNPDFRKLLVNAVLWTARVDVPPGGAKDDITPEDLKQHLFPFKE